MYIIYCTLYNVQCRYNMSVGHVLCVLLLINMQVPLYCTCILYMTYVYNAQYVHVYCIYCSCVQGLLYI